MMADFDSLKKSTWKGGDYWLSTAFTDAMFKHLQSFDFLKC